MRVCLFVRVRLCVRARACVHMLIWWSLLWRCLLAVTQQQKALREKKQQHLTLMDFIHDNNNNNDDEDDDGAVKVQGLTKIQVGYIRCLLMASIVEKVVAWGRAPLVEGAEAAEPVGAAGN